MHSIILRHLIFVIFQLFWSEFCLDQMATELFKDSSQNLNQNSAHKNSLLQKLFVYIMDGLDCLGRCRSSVLLAFF
jgi:hypothetical protein